MCTKMFVLEILEIAEKFKKDDEPMQKFNTPVKYKTLCVINVIASNFELIRYQKNPYTRTFIAAYLCLTPCTIYSITFYLLRPTIEIMNKTMQSIYY